MGILESTSSRCKDEREFLTGKPNRSSRVAGLIQGD